jgi:predicted transcriptional regulator
MDADRARQAVRKGFGDETVQFNGGHYFRQITDADVVELTTLDKAIKELQEQRASIASQMYERGGQLTNQHVADLGDASQAACEEFERMLDDGDELDTDEGRLTDSAVEDIVEAAMSNHPGKFIRYSEEEIAEALGAYGY